MLLRYLTQRNVMTCFLSELLCVKEKGNILEQDKRSDKTGIKDRLRGGREAERSLFFEILFYNN